MQADGAEQEAGDRAVAAGAQYQQVRTRAEVQQRLGGGCRDQLRVHGQIAVAMAQLGLGPLQHASPVLLLAQRLLGDGHIERLGCPGVEQQDGQVPPCRLVGRPPRSRHARW